MTRLQNEKYYDKFSTMYEQERHKRYHRFLDESELSAARPYVTGGKVLEVGCGTGLVLEPLSQMANEAVGIDISRGMLRKALARGLNAAQASATDLPFADNTFDAVVSFKVLAHIEAIQQTMSECTRVLKPGGHLVLEFYNKQSLRHLVKVLKPAHKVATSTTDDQVYTRYDSLEEIKGYLPTTVSIEKTVGIRCLAPTYHFFNAPLLGAVVDKIERSVQNTPIGRLGGFLIVVARKL
jgi:ubiquinone/menaquinone biosynthesis C-methylase UbiE